MGLVDDINANTAYVASAKLALERALRDKGVQVTENNTSFPTFDQLTTAIEGSMMLSDITGSEDALVYANEDIVKGDVCSLIEAKGSFQAVSAIPALPTSFKPYINKTDTSPLLLTDDNYRIVSINEGEIVMLPTSSWTLYVPFLLIDGKYKQLSIDGVYAGNYWSKSSITYNYAFDSENNLLFCSVGINLMVYKLNRDTLDLVTIATIAIGSGKNACAQALYAKNKCVFYGYYSDTSDYNYTSIGRFDEATNTLVDRTTVSPSTTAYKKSVVVTDLTGDVGNGEIYCVLADHYTGSYTDVFVRKLVYDSTSGQYTLGAYSPSKVRVRHKSSFYNAKKAYGSDLSNVAQITLSGQGLYTIDNSTTLHFYLVDPVTMALTEAPMTFADGFDTTKVANFTVVKGTNYLYVLSTDTDSYAANELLRLYKYNVNTSTFDFVCCPAKDTFQPLLNSDTLPYYMGLWSGKRTLAKNVNSNWQLYDVGEAALEMEYYANKSNNMLGDGDGYAIAKYDIAKGDFGNVTKILG